MPVRIRPSGSRTPKARREAGLRVTQLVTTCPLPIVALQGALRNTGPSVSPRLVGEERSGALARVTRIGSCPRRLRMQRVEHRSDRGKLRCSCLERVRSFPDARAMPRCAVQTARRLDTPRGGGNGCGYRSRPCDQPLRSPSVGTTPRVPRADVSGEACEHAYREAEASPALFIGEALRRHS